MNEVDMLRASVAALTMRVNAVEQLSHLLQVVGRDAMEAYRVAQGLRQPEDTLVNTDRREDRRRLARELHRQGWSAARIARVLHVCERTAERYISSA